MNTDSIVRFCARPHRLVTCNTFPRSSGRKGGQKREHIFYLKQKLVNSSTVTDPFKTSFPRFSKTNSEHFGTQLYIFKLLQSIFNHFILSCALNSQNPHKLQILFLGQKLSVVCSRMKDWASPIIATALFAFLSPGVIFQLPGRQHPVDFMNMKTSWVSILVHAIIYGLLLMLFLVILHARLYV